MEAILSVTYCLIAILLALNTNGLRNALELVRVALLELSVGRGSELDRGGLVHTLMDGAIGRGLSLLRVGDAIDVLRGNRWDVASVACDR